jgi:hypothetical protein
LAEQTGLMFTEETRKVRVLFVEEQKTGGEPKPGDVRP